MDKISDLIDVSLEYRLYELKLIINRELYEDKVIDLGVYREMEKYILSKLNKLKCDNN